MHRPTESRLQRGVYTLPFLSRCGRTMLVAVDRKGRLVTRALMFKRDNKAVVVRMLRNILDQEDPPVPGYGSGSM